MNISFYNAVSGMLGYQKSMDVTSNNIANVNTAGFKKQNAVFADLLYSRLDTHNNEDMMMGHGSRMESLNFIYKQGALEYTERPLDFAISGEGLFAIEAANGETRYTRGGSFQISVEGSKSFLVTSAGEYVLDSKRKPIQLPLDESGSGYDLTGLIDQLGVFLFENPYGLTPVGSTAYQESDTSGRVRALADLDSTVPCEVVGGALERSNIDLADEMVNVIHNQRAFQLNARVVKVSDEIEELVNSLR